VDISALLASATASEDSTEPSLPETEVMARDLMRQYGLTDWEFQWDNAQARAGQCLHPTKSKPGVISLSRKLTTLWGTEEMRDIVLHEIAHALAGHEHGHDATWKRICQHIGARPQRCYDTDPDLQGMPAPYIGTCPHGHTGNRYKRPPQTPRSCVQCAPHFDTRYLITWTANPDYHRPNL
jgi:predicted SprT family Zn-dependent metalloprotease